MLGKIRLHGINGALRMNLTLASILVRNALFGEKRRVISAPQFYSFIAHKHALDALAGRVLDF
jgi:hypothetical protein